MKALAAKRRKLPLGGELKEDYVFQWANEGKVGAGQILGALWRQEFADPLLVDVRPELGQSVPVVHVADGWVRPRLVFGQPDTAFVAISKAPAEKINAWATKRGWSQIPLLSGYELTFQADYKCQEPNDDDKQQPVMHTFTKRDEKIFHFWATETMQNHVDTVWPHWNLFDFTPEGRPDHDTPPQKFRSRFLEEHYLEGESAVVG